MAAHITVSAVHHLTLTVTDRERSRDFYGRILGFQPVAEFGPKIIMSNGAIMLSVSPPPEHPLPGDRFDENRVGLDHLSFAVQGRADLEAALQLLDAEGVPHGEITDLEPFRIHILSFRDPDNIQLELTAPYG